MTYKLSPFLFFSLLFIVVTLYPTVTKSQIQHTHSSNNIDSVLNLIYELTGKGKPDSALKLSSFIENKIVESYGKQSAIFGKFKSYHGRIYYYKGLYKMADSVLQEALKIQELADDKWNLDLAATSYMLGNVYNELSKFKNAIEYHTRALNIRDSLLGKNSQAYASSLTSLSTSFLHFGNPSKAEQCILEAIAIQESILGKEHSDYLSSIDNYANLLRKQGKLEDALAYRIESKNTRFRILGKEHPSYANSLNNLANLFSDLGRYDEALNLYKEVIDLRAVILGKSHPNYLRSLNNLTQLYQKLGYYELAESLILENMNIRKKLNKKTDKDYIDLLINTNALYIKMDQFARAEIILVEAKSLIDSLLGPQSLEAAKCLSAMARLFGKIGSYKKAEENFLEAVHIIESSNFVNNIDHGKTLNNLGVLYANMNQFEKAEAILLKALAIKEKILGNTHIEYVRTLHNLASLYFKMKYFIKSEEYFNAAFKITQQTDPKEELFYTQLLNGMGMLYLELGDMNKAEKLLIESNEIFIKLLGKYHYEYSASTYNLAKLYIKKNESNKAAKYLMEYAKVDVQIINKAIHYYTESELLNYFELFHFKQGQLYSFIYNLKEPLNQDLQDLIIQSMNNLLYFKGLLLNKAVIANTQNINDPESIKKHNEYKSIMRRLVNEYSQPVTHNKIIDSLESRCTQIQKELSLKSSKDMALNQAMDWHVVQNQLLPNEAAIEFVSFPYYNDLKTDSVFYAALLIKKNVQKPLFFRLFEQKQLDSLLLLAKIIEDPKSGCNAIYSHTGKLFDLVWRPILHELEDVHKIYYSKSGLLHRFNLAAIPISEHQLMADKFKMKALGSMRQLSDEIIDVDSLHVHLQKNKSEPMNFDALLFGGIEYEIDSSIHTDSLNFQSQIVAARGVTSTDLTAPSFSKLDSTLRGNSWYFLKWTEKEVNTISNILKKQKILSKNLKSTQATEDNFKKTGQDFASPKIIHFATHGYFFEDRNEKLSDNLLIQPTLDEPIFKTSEHPMIRSGLILAGANYAWKHGRPYKDGMEDGILTAYEISQMNLSNTELVVLSACETGLGDIKGNEGVYGLQRAFKIAGVKYLIMSLWSVPDKQTAQFMTSFYKNWIEQKMNIPDAFQAAQKQLRNLGLDPYYWAGFVLVE